MQKVDITTPFDETWQVKEKFEPICQIPEIKLNPKMCTPYDSVRASSKVNISTKGLKMPKTLAKLVQVIKKQNPSISRRAIVNILLCKISQMLCSKRIKYAEQYKVGYPNYYALNFMPSGTGKDKLLYELDTYVFYPFQIWFKLKYDDFRTMIENQFKISARKKYPKEEQANQREKYVKEKMNEIRNMTIDVSDGTREGFFADAKTFKMADFGCIMIKLAEFGQYLSNIITEQRLFLNVLFEGYDGKVVSKSIQSRQREATIEDIPICALLYSDHTLFKEYLENFFRVLMQTGLGRRCVITFMPKKEMCKLEPDPYKAFQANEKYYEDLKALGNELVEIFDKIEINAQYELTKEAFTDCFYPYILKLKELEDSEENELVQKEISSRELKALKIAALYACLNHPELLKILPEDMEMAIDTVEMLSKDFKKFLNYKPTRPDRYSMLFNFFLEHKGESFTKTALTTKYYAYSGLSRDKFKDSFDKDMALISEIAREQGFLLDKKSINNNSGNQFTLIELHTEEASDSTEKLEDLI